MKIKKSIILFFPLLTVLITSCNTKSIDPAEYYAEWKAQNESYFVNMKDSVGYVLYTIPANQGGSSYYYKITSPGDQNSGSPKLTDNVKVNYRGKIINGSIFDQTYKGVGIPVDSTATPRTFLLNGLIPGWQVNLLQMKAGEKRTIILPQELGYGTYGGGAIPPYSTLVFDIQLISFTPGN